MNTDICRVVGCENMQYYKSRFDGYCQFHYTRHLYRKSEKYKQRDRDYRKKIEKKCNIPLCRNKSRRVTIGLCGKHLKNLNTCCTMGCKRFAFYNDLCKSHTNYSKNTDLYETNMSIESGLLEEFNLQDGNLIQDFDVQEGDIITL
jgi:hypothetical protein